MQSSLLFAEELRVTLRNGCRVTFNVISLLPARQRREQSCLSSASTCMVVSEEFIQTIRAQTIKCTGVGMWGGENGPGSTRVQAGLPPDCSRRNLQPLVRPWHRPGEDPRRLRSEGPRYAELWAAAFPLDVLTPPSPHTQLPPEPGAANAFVVFLEGRLQASSLYTRRDKQAHPATAGQPQFPLQPRFCYKLWHTVVPRKKCSVSKNWF